MLTKHLLLQGVNQTTSHFWRFPRDLSEEIFTYVYEKSIGNYVQYPLDRNSFMTYLNGIYRYDTNSAVASTCRLPITEEIGRRIPTEVRFNSIWFCINTSLFESQHFDRVHTTLTIYQDVRSNVLLPVLWICRPTQLK